jgi:addiction module RelE/StbE family toxin
MPACCGFWSDWPIGRTCFGAKPLSGNLAGHYRIRTGDYRLVFRLEGQTIVVVKIGHRSRLYGD